MMPVSFGADLFNPLKKPEYFYRVIQSVIAFDNENKIVNHYEHVQDFKSSILRNARNEAFTYVAERHVDFPESFIYPFFSPEEYRKNPNKEHAKYSYSIALVEWYSEENYEEYVVIGEDEDTNQQGLDFEAEIFKSLG